MEPTIVSAIGFGAAVLIAALLMVAFSFFSMKESSYESAMLKRKREIGIDDKEIKVATKHKREHLKKKPDIKKKKVENLRSSTSHTDASSDKPTVSSANDEKHILKESNEISKGSEVGKKPKPTKQKKEVDQLENFVIKTEATTSSTSNTKLVKNETTKLVQPFGKSDVSTKPNNSKLIKTESPKNVVGSTKTAEKSSRNLEPSITSKKENAQSKMELAKSSKKSDTLDGKSFKTKTSQKEKSILQLIQSTSMDGDEIDMLINVLNQKSGQGDWTRADGGSRKGQSAELQKQLNMKSLELLQQTQELEKQQQKMKQVLEELDVLKKKEKKQESQVELTKHDYFQRQLELEKALEEKKKIILSLQNQIHTVSDVTGDITQLKDENEILRATIQANANIVSDKEHYLREVQLTQAKLEESNCKRTEAEQKLAEFSQLLAQKKNDAEVTYTKHIDEVTSKLRISETKCHQFESELQKSQTDLQMAQSESAKLLNQVTLLSEENEQHSLVSKRIADTEKALEQRLNEMEANEAKKAEELAKLHTRAKDLAKRVSELEAEKEVLSNELHCQKAAAAKVVDERQTSNSIISEKDSLIDSLKSEVEAFQSSCKRLESELEKLKKKNNELRERNWKAMEAVATAEKTCKERIASQKEEANKTSEKWIEQVRSDLKLAFPSITVSSTNFQTWLNEFITSIKTSSSEANKLVQSKEQAISKLKQDKIEQMEKTNKLNSSMESLQKTLDNALKRNKCNEDELKGLKKISGEKEAEIGKYKNILESTETILQSLQASVEQEENKKTSHSKDSRELIRLKKELEAKTSLVDRVNNECENLRRELAMINEDSFKTLKEIGNKEDQGFLIVEQIAQSPADASNQNEEIAKLKERLDKEKELTKSLGAAANRLQSVLKQTQDELNKEREKNGAKENN